ncbi:mitochondrial-processing peptidase subunit alpha [Ixodes scapularis]
MLEAPWRETSVVVISNCFRKARITKEVETAEECPVTGSGEEEPSSPPILPKLGFHCVQTEQCQTTCSCATFCMLTDDCTVTTEEMSDDVLVESVRYQDDDDGPSEVDASRDLPSTKEVLDAIDVLHHAAGLLDDDGAMLCKIKEEDIHRVVQRMLRGRASVAALGNLSGLPPLEDIETGLLSKEGMLPTKRFSIFRQ